MKKYIEYKNFEYLCNLFAGFFMALVGFNIMFHLSYSDTTRSIISGLAVTCLCFGLMNIITRLIVRKIDIGIIPNILFIIGFIGFLLIIWQPSVFY